jgi:hypothetical protein
MQDEFGTRRTPTPGRGATGDRTVVTGMFDTLEEAQRAYDGLVREGFDRDDISLIASNAAGEHDRYLAEREGRYRDDDIVDADDLGPGEGAAAGGGIGAAIGGVGGVLMGLGLLAIPGVGPALAAGPLVSGLVGAGIGGAAGGITGALVNSGVPEERAGAYAEGIRRGGTLVAVETTAAAAPRAEDVLIEYGVVDIDERVTHWQDEGWSGFDPAADPYTPEMVERERSRYGKRTMTGQYRR